MRNTKTSVKRSYRRSLLSCLSILALSGMTVLLSLGITSHSPGASDVTTAATRSEAAPASPKGADFSRLPLSFETNQGQTDPQVRFLSRGSGYTLFLTSTKAVLMLQDRLKNAQTETAQSSTNVLRLDLVGANPDANAEALDELPGKSNYFVGNDPKNWHVDVPTFKKVNYSGVYPGVDLVYYGNQRQLEYDFVVAPNADASQIRWAVPPADIPEMDTGGGLVLHVNGSDVQMKKPVVYQAIDGERREVAAAYSIRHRTSGIKNNEIGFALGEYDHAVPLVIDPVVVFSSSLLDGNNNDDANAVAVDSSGNAYVTGETASTTFPTVSPIQATLSGGQDAFISKFNTAGTALVYSTYLGGNTGFENGWDIAVDASGNAYVTGRTTALDFPVTAATAFQATKSTNNTVDAGFVTKLNANGTLAYSTYLYGPQGSTAYGIATDGSGNAYVVGRTGTGFPITASAFSSTNFSSGFLTKLNTNASGAASLIYSSYLGPNGFSEGHAVAVDAAGNAYITGNANSTSTGFASAGAFQATYGGGSADAFVAKFNTSLSGAASRVYATYLGGSANDYGGLSTASGSKAIAIDPAGNAYVTGQTISTNFPVLNAVQAATGGNTDAFLTKLNPSGSALIYSTYLGGSGASNDEGHAVAVDILGNAYVTGLTNSANFPTVSPLSTPDGTTGGAFLAKYTPSGTAMVYSTRFGTAAEQGLGLALDSVGNAFVTSDRASATFVAEIADPTVIGRVVDENGAPIAGALVSIAGAPAGTTSTDANGLYTFGVLVPGNSYSVSVTFPNYVFLAQPVNNLVKNVRVDFSPVVFSIGGQVTNAGNGMAGVILTLTDGKSLGTTTDANGNYSFAGLPASRNYTVTPSSGSLIFSPTNGTFANLSANQTANFIVVIPTPTPTPTASPTPGPPAQVSGQVLGSDNRGVRSATVVLTDSNGVKQSAVTSSLGFYSFAQIPTGKSYTLTAISKRFRFSIMNIQVNGDMTINLIGLE